MTKIFVLVETLLSLFCGAIAVAQLGPADDHLDSGFLQPQISVGFATATVRNFQDIDGTFGANSASLTAIVPIYRDHEGAIDASTDHFLLARGQFTSLNENISFLPSSHAVYKSRIGFTGGIATTHHHLYLMTVGAGFAEDRNTFGSPRVRATGSLLGKYQLDDSFGFIYGLSYSYTFNRGLLLPLLGARCSLGNDLSLHIVLPFSMEIDYEEAQELLFGFIIRANGDQIHIEENSYFGTQSLPLFMKIAQIQVGFRVSLKLSREFWLRGEAGVLRDRNFGIGTLGENLVSSKIDNSGYSTIILTYDLGSFESW
jgi:hypothetical protein